MNSFKTGLKPFFLVIVCLTAFSCKDKDEKEVTPKTEKITFTGNTTIKEELADGALMDFSFSSSTYGVEVIEFGFVYSSTANVSHSNGNIRVVASDTIVRIYGTAPLTYSGLVTALEKETTYYVNSYLKTKDDSVHYGTETTFTTIDGNRWVQQYPEAFPGPSSFFTSFEMVGTEIYVVAGTQYTSRNGEPDVPNEEFYKTNILTNKWTRLADYPGKPAAMPPFFAIGKKMYLVNGDAQETWEYDIDTDKWTRKADLPSQMTGLLKGFILGNKIYCGLSLDAEYSKHWWVYDPAETSNGTDDNGNPKGKWTRLPDAPVANPIKKEVFTANGKGYVFIGRDLSIDAAPIYEFDPADNSWTHITNYPGTITSNSTSDAHEYAFVINNKLYISFGFISVASPEELWSYDLGTKQWAEITPQNQHGSISWNKSFTHENIGYVFSSYVINKYIP